MATVTTDQVRAYEDGWFTADFEWDYYADKYVRGLEVDEQFKPVLKEAWDAGWDDLRSNLPKWHSLECFKDDHGEC